ncbi:MAG: hypothetical protein QNJ94_10100 [Alphaproteobacteria bacterium]|nr:hypothetical protein [Alphaproteobacteria bacterium]
MRTKRLVPPLVLGLVCAAGAQAANGENTVTDASYMKTAFEKFRGHVADCSKRHEYDPAKPPKIGKHALAPDERDWRLCYYEGVEAHLIPNSNWPEKYRELIGLDRHLTNKIVMKRATRAERDAVVGELIMTIELQEAERAAAAAEDSGPKFQPDSLQQRVIDDVRSF